MGQHHPAAYLFIRLNRHDLKPGMCRHFKPSGGLLGCSLTDFVQEVIGCSMDNWDATFSEQWTCSDLVDCIISYAVTKIVETIAIDGVPRFRP